MYRTFSPTKVNNQINSLLNVSNTTIPLKVNLSFKIINEKVATELLHFFF